MRPVSGYTFASAGWRNMSTAVGCGQQLEIGARFRGARLRTLKLCAPLTAEDMMVQSCAEARRRSGTWLIRMVLRVVYSSRVPVRLSAVQRGFFVVFNSYYESFDKFPEKRLRASFSRPALDEILRYRAHVTKRLSACWRTIRTLRR